MGTRSLYRIFILSDEPDLADALSEALEGEGYAPIICRQLSSALVEIHSALPRLIIIASSRLRDSIEISHIELICRDALVRGIGVLALLPYPLLTRHRAWLQGLRCTFLGQPFLHPVLINTVAMLMR